MIFIWNVPSNEIDLAFGFDCLFSLKSSDQIPVF